MECRHLRESMSVLTDLLAFEVIARDDGRAVLKHPNSDWRLVVHEGGPDAPEKAMLNHWGVRVTTRAEVDAAAEYLRVHQARYGLRHVGQPSFAHGSYSLYFLEPGTNGWEIECYEDALRRGKGAERLGGVWVPHWERPLPPERFPGRGYVPQAFTHGTIACGDKSASEPFYTEVLGLDVHHPNKQAMYLKTPESRCYVVSAVRERWTRCSSSFRFTLEVAPGVDVAAAHRWLAESGGAVGMTALGRLETRGGAPSFLVSDPDENWWEIVDAAGGQPLTAPAP
jgi:catechol 2,3-dioxygenase-like lactoylglutathione lyase family enzyme